MKRFFGTDSPSFRFMTILLELAEINLLFLLCSIPIVTIGAAYSAMLHSLYGMHKYGEGCFSVKMFFRVFRRSLKPLIPAWCVIVICYILLGCNINYIINNTQGMIRFIGCGVYIVLLLFVSGIMQYLSIFVALSEKWNRDFLKNSFLLTLAKFPVVILTSLLSMSVFIVALFPVSMMLRLLPLVILFWIVCPAYVCVGIYMRVLKPLFPELFDF